MCWTTQIREVRHDNLNTFIGACVDPGSVCVLTEYCSRGSLRDILGKQALKLDSMFVASLVFDILKVHSLGQWFLTFSLLGSPERDRCRLGPPSQN